MSSIDALATTIAAAEATLGSVLRELEDAVVARDGDRTEALVRRIALARAAEPAILWRCGAGLFHVGRLEAALEFMELSVPLAAPFDKLSALGEISLQNRQFIKALRYFQALFQSHADNLYAFERLQRLRLLLLEQILREDPAFTFWMAQAVIDTSRAISPSIRLRSQFAHKAAHALLMTIPPADIDLLHTEIRARCGARVAQGPFAGMLSPDDSVNGFPASMMLGCYEPQLIPIWNAVIAGPYDRLLNIGSAEGYYVVGFARAKPELRVVGWETLENKRATSRALAELNGVSDRIDILGQAEISGICQAAALAERPLMIMDIEGAELDILSSQAIAQLSRCDFVIEAHDCYRADATATLTARFATTHDCAVLEEGFSNPDDVPMLDGLPELIRWLAVCEMRPHRITWIIARSRAHAGQPLRLD